MPTWVKTLIIGIVVFALMYVLNAMMSATGFFGVGINDYQGRLLVFIAINVILATSLNLINGFTGQFSIGHAGFMAVGAYSSAYFTVSWNQCGLPADVLSRLEYPPPQMLCSLKAGLPAVPETLSVALILLTAIVIGAIIAAIAGLIVGIPSLRLKGDYLAIVTLGFAEIIRIVIVNINTVGGATGYT